MRALVPFCLVVWVFALFCCSSAANALPDAWQSSFAYHLRQGAKAGYAYVWGGRGPDVLVYDTKAKRWAKGVDCFFFVYMSAKNAGIRGVRIVTSRAAAQGKGGWTGKDISLAEVEPTDLGFVIWHANDGSHMGVFLVGEESALLEYFHASSGKRRVINVPFPPLLPLGEWKFRRLTIGDRPS